MFTGPYNRGMRWGYQTERSSRDKAAPLPLVKTNSVPDHDITRGSCLPAVSGSSGAQSHNGSGPAQFRRPVQFTVQRQGGKGFGTLVNGLGQEIPVQHLYI